MSALVLHNTEEISFVDDSLSISVRLIYHFLNFFVAERLTKFLHDVLELLGRDEVVLKWRAAGIFLFGYKSV